MNKPTGVAIRTKFVRRGISTLTQAIPVIGITGTNGKTTTTHLLGHIFKAAGKNPATIGTLGTQYNNHHTSHLHTTPEALRLHKLLRKMKVAKVNAVAMEISSHALDLHRIEDVCFDAAVFTNLTPEHLDYHHTMEEYYCTKARLFSEILPKGKGQKLAIINADDPYGARLIKALPGQPVWTYSTQDKGSTWDFQVREAHYDLHGMKGVIVTPKGTEPFATSLIGAFNLSNILAATAGALSIDIPLTTITKALKDFPGVPGRLEKIENNRGIHVFVDYAHTPDALKNVLTALRALNPKKIITVFGCGGNRDRQKRPLMGQEVARLSDITIVTSDNPRTEDPRQIIQEILAGIKTGGLVIPDRREAIELAIKKATPGDVVLIAGKGHETYQIIGTEKIHFDDREVARVMLNTN
ncbi:MAG: UDP-N-acetylmuramoyl-L-alanyl-D-glutamate--2,6-diaminopimelate ligase [Deltaproteobacteria bacterium]|nr:UDP-N-acetylmuramoyl-L-alanyl-D-glutamate--2,6-diaminopimelate ligase [Deltaproteobacteria bacterium]